MFTFLLQDLVTKHIEKSSSSPAIIKNGEEISFAKLNQDSDYFANYLRMKGIRKFDRVLLISSSTYGEIVTYFAICKVGGIAVFVPRVWKWHRVKLAIEKVIPKMIIGLEFYFQKEAEEIGKENLDLISSNDKLDQPSNNLVIKNWKQCLVYENYQKQKVIDQDPATILFTSGSTGNPKGVTLSHLNIIQSARAAAKFLKNSSSDRLLGALPLSFDYGLSQLTTAFLVGGTYVLPDSFFPSSIVSQVLRDRVTGLAGVPTMWQDLTGIFESKPECLKTLRYITNSGDRLSKPLLKQVKSVFKDVEIFLMYGMTESFRTSYLDPKKIDEKESSVGNALPNVEIILEGQSENGDGSLVGNLIHRGSTVSMGYWGDEHENKCRFKNISLALDLPFSFSVCDSGDKVKIDPDGDCYLIGRNSHFVKCSGHRVNIIEIEEAAYQTELVSYAVAIPKPDSRLGTVIDIAIWSKLKFSKNEFIIKLRKFLPDFLIPRKIYLMDSDLPLTGSGKPDRPKILNEINEGKNILESLL